MASKAQLFISLLHLPSPSKPKSLSIGCCLSIEQARNDQTTSSNKAPTGLRVAFAAGGTGGHIYPVVAIADELKLVNPTSKFIFLGCPNSMESTEIPSAHFEFKSIPAVQLARPFVSLRNLLLPYRLIESIIKCYILLSRFGPHVVIGTGGYVSFPVCLAALLKGVEVVVQEQNSVPGIANRVLSLFADLVFVAFNSTVESFPRKEKCVVCGESHQIVFERFSRKGGVDVAFFPMARNNGGFCRGDKSGFGSWRTGVHSFDEMESLVRNHHRLLLTPFLHSMDMAYAAADLIVSQAGAMTCSEILATGKPVILVPPSPNVAEGHQHRNASLMADIAGNERLLAEMSERALKAAKPDASSEIAKRILSLINLSGKEVDG
ncbi:putative Octicosapeptide/Phox/Bem1p family protein [Hibiscus syriacus]|uniref:Octicosapeptide/Phox/Bem1p family protein n=1 Tax=Hibiscus syriacus TaxID=106335 RepID=A0A6A3B0R1_HIBSY|nr:putative Octicosapeptide/Phox/Bem1p family protein [Hibiscus syriacus]